LSYGAELYIVVLINSILFFELTLFSLKKRWCMPLLIDLYINLHKGFYFKKKHPLSQGSDPILTMAQIHNLIRTIILENELWHVGTRTLSIIEQSSPSIS